eukprot:5867485-Alexandrium_andersonii.AAC.1
MCIRDRGRRRDQARLSSLAVRLDDTAEGQSGRAPWWRCTLCNFAVRHEDYVALSNLPGRHRSHLSEARRKHLKTAH